MSDEKASVPEEGTDGVDLKFETALERLAGKVVDSQSKLAEELTQSVGESISAGVKAALEDIGAPQERGSVRAARYTVTREEPIYRFDGTGNCLVATRGTPSTAGRGSDRADPPLPPPDGRGGDADARPAAGVRAADDVDGVAGCAAAVPA